MNKNTWLEIDKEGLRKTLSQKDKVFILNEMVSNAWDEDITEVQVSLTHPDENGFSWLQVTDNSPTGWADLSHSHTMFAESVKRESRRSVAGSTLARKTSWPSQSKQS